LPALLKLDRYPLVHKTLRVTPAIEAGIADHAWNIEGIVELLGV
jgi:hypothetical protein